MSWARTRQSRARRCAGPPGPRRRGGESASRARGRGTRVGRASRHRRDRSFAGWHKSAEGGVRPDLEHHPARWLHAEPLLERSRGGPHSPGHPHGAAGIQHTPLAPPVANIESDCYGRQRANLWVLGLEPGSPWRPARVLRISRGWPSHLNLTGASVGRARPRRRSDAELRNINFGTAGLSPAADARSVRLHRNLTRGVDVRGDG